MPAIFRNNSIVRPGKSTSQRGAVAAASEVDVEPTSAGQKKKKSGRGGGGGSGQQVSHTVSHMEQARMESGLSFSHFVFGAKAKRCKTLCNGSRN